MIIVSYATLCNLPRCIPNKYYVPNYNMCVKACCFVQLTEVERTRSMLEVDNNSLKRRLAAMSADTIQVKEEVRSHHFTCKHTIQY